MAGTANTFKFSTLLWFVVGIAIPLWPITLPLCWFMAYRSYKNGTAPAGTLSDLQAAAALRESGVLSEQEFETAKARALGTRQ